jgi:hypothetical protein
LAAISPQLHDCSLKCCFDQENECRGALIDQSTGSSGSGSGNTEQHRVQQQQQQQQQQQGLPACCMLSSNSLLGKNHISGQLVA